MNSILLCEGSTDFVLLQYFMREVYGWEDKEKGVKFLRPSRRLQKEENEMVIGGTGGSSQILPKFQKIIESNALSSMQTEYYQKIAIVTDHDDIDTEENFLQQIQNILQESQIDLQRTLQVNTWNYGEMVNARGERLPIQILLLVIPFEETGAMETFLLDAIAEKDDYDKAIINQGNRFVEQIDSEKRYLNSRRYITKAKFDVYFSIRTPATFFRERQDILRGINWREYTKIQDSFRALEQL